MTVGTVEPHIERSPRDRRIEQRRRTLELWLDNLFRPAGWAAALSYRLGLQGRVRVSETTIRPPRAPRRTTPLRVAFASDFHAGPTTHSRVLESACEALAELRPDVLLLGGDFVSVRASYIDRLAPLIASIDAPFGKFAVLGNHDLRANFAVVTAALERAGVRMIINDRVTLDAPFDDVTIAGLDDPVRGVPRPDLALDRVDGASQGGESGSGTLRIVLMHSPENLPAIGDRPFDLALCGHTHGGQIALPWGTPILLPGGPLNREYCRGRFDLDGPECRTLLVSRGVGCSTVPARMFAAPEVHLCLIT